MSNKAKGWVGRSMDFKDVDKRKSVSNISVPNNRYHKRRDVMYILGFLLLSSMCRPRSDILLNILCCHSRLPTVLECRRSHLDVSMENHKGMGTEGLADLCPWDFSVSHFT